MKKLCISCWGIFYRLTISPSNSDSRDFTQEKRQK